MMGPLSMFGARVAVLVWWTGQGHADPIPYAFMCVLPHGRAAFVAGGGSYLRVTHIAPPRSAWAEKGSFGAYFGGERLQLREGPDRCGVGPVGVLAFVLSLNDDHPVPDQLVPVSLSGWLFWGD